MKRDLIPAPIDEKNVTTDWLESIFDNDCFARDTCLMIGLIRHCAVQCTWNYNKITWKVSTELGTGDPVEALCILGQRLRDAESEEQNIYSCIIIDSQYTITQKFYFKED